MMQIYWDRLVERTVCRFLWSPKWKWKWETRIQEWVTFLLIKYGYAVMYVNSVVLCILMKILQFLELPKAYFLERKKKFNLLAPLEVRWDNLLGILCAIVVFPSLWLKIVAIHKVMKWNERIREANVIQTFFIVDIHKKKIFCMKASTQSPNE